ncbi:hypothetical protein P7K49_012239, partial [Saguinus oedipus]
PHPGTPPPGGPPGGVRASAGASLLLGDTTVESGLTPDTPTPLPGKSILYTPPPGDTPAGSGPHSPPSWGGRVSCAPRFPDGVCLKGPPALPSSTSVRWNSPSETHQPV